MPSESVTAQIYAQATVDWRMAGRAAGRRAVTRCSKCRRQTSANMDANALALGQKVAADGVIYGSVNKFRERVGLQVLPRRPRPRSHLPSISSMRQRDRSCGRRSMRAAAEGADRKYFRPAQLYPEQGAAGCAPTISPQEGVRSRLANLYSKTDYSAGAAGPIATLQMTPR